MSDQPDPPGTATERTALAWQRTAMTLAAGGAGLARLTAGSLGWPALVLGGLAAAFGVAALVTSVRRGRQTAAGPSRPGLTPLLVVLAVWLLGTGGLAHTLAR